VAKIGTIAIDIVARTGKLMSGTKKAAARLGGFTKAATGLGTKLAAVATAAAGAALAFAGVASITSKVWSQFAEVDVLAKTSDKLGIATEALVGFHHAAALMAGITDTAVNNSLERMGKRISEAAAGFGSAKGAIEELGLDAVELNAIGSEAALMKIADAMQSVTNQNDRLRLAQNLFGKEGRSMVNMLRNGSEGLAEMRKDAEKLGIALSRTDAAKIEQTNDAITRLQALFTGIARRISVELAPFLTFAVNKLTEFGTQGEGSAGMVRGAIDGVITAIGYFLDGIDALRDGFAAMQLGAQIALSAIASGVAVALQFTERAAEGIAGAFHKAFAEVRQLAAETYAGLVRQTASFFAFLGKGTSGDSFLKRAAFAGFDMAKELEGQAAEARMVLDGVDFSKDFDFSSAATGVADAMKMGLDTADKDFERFLGRERMSDQLRKNVDKIRADAEAAADAVEMAGPEDVPGADARTSQTQVAALMRGSTEAFSAFLKAQGGSGADTEDKILEESKKTARATADIARNLTTADVLRVANFA
jgi:hypothetical protein